MLGKQKPHAQAQQHPSRLRDGKKASAAGIHSGVKLPAAYRQEESVRDR
jgi:hypothetical protein